MILFIWTIVKKILKVIKKYGFRKMILHILAPLVKKILKAFMFIAW